MRNRNGPLVLLLTQIKPFCQQMVIQHRQKYGPSHKYSIYSDSCNGTSNNGIRSN